MKPLPPYGKQWLADPPGAGLWVAIGPTAWNFAKARAFPVPILPDDAEPADYRWPAHRGGATIFECGIFDDDRLSAMATELLTAGSPFVVAIREALLDSDPHVYFYKDAQNVAA